MQLILWSLIFIASLVVLIKAASYFIKCSSYLGIAFGISSFMVGVTIVAIGTSMPELVTGLISVLQKNPVSDFVIADVVGSNIANSMLALGLVAVLFGRLIIKKELIDVDIPLLFTSTALFIFFIWDGSLNMVEGSILLLYFILFIFYTIRNRKRISKDEYKNFKDKNSRPEVIKKQLGWLSLKIVICVFLMYLGGKFLVKSVMEISDILSISSALITISVVALGTSLPEIVTSIVAAKKKEYSIAIGNAFGSSVFNILFVASIPAFFHHLTVSPEVMAIGIPFLAVTTLALILAALDNMIRQWEGGGLLLLYLAFIGKLFGLF